MFKYSDSNKRYYTLDYFYRKRFKTKIAKISLNANFTCPNIDGQVGYGGCIYCCDGSSAFGGNPQIDLIKQFEQIKLIINHKWPKAKYIAYFQAHTNTYAPVAKLKATYEPFLNYPEVVGINIATRSDAISDECLAYLSALNKQTFLTIELGLQTIHPKTAKLINRCLSLANFEQMVYKLKANHIQVVVHIINGLPGETKEMMIETVKYLSSLPIDGIKFHELEVLKGTPLATMYQTNPFHILTKQEYVDIVCDQLEYLRPDIVIHRLTSDSDPKLLIAPLWLTKKLSILDAVDLEMVKRNSYQGKRLV